MGPKRYTAKRESEMAGILARKESAVKMLASIRELLLKPGEVKISPAQTEPILYEAGA